MDDFELDQDEPFSPVKVLIVGSLMLVFGLCLVSYPAYRVISSGSDSGAGTLENARTFTCIGCEPTQWKPGDDPPTAPVRPAPKGTGTEAADVAPPIVASLRRRRRRRRPPQLSATASGRRRPPRRRRPPPRRALRRRRPRPRLPRPPRPRHPPRRRRPRPRLRPRRRPPSRSRDADSASSPTSCATS